MYYANRKIVSNQEINRLGSVIYVALSFSFLKLLSNQITKMILFMIYESRPAVPLMGFCSFWKMAVCGQVLSTSSKGSGQFMKL